MQWDDGKVGEDHETWPNGYGHFCRQLCEWLGFVITTCDIWECDVQDALSTFI
jgi:hypothetical protein